MDLLNDVAAIEMPARKAIHPDNGFRCRSALRSVVMTMTPQSQAGQRSRLPFRKDWTMRYTLLLHYPEMSPEELGPAGQQHGQRAFAAYADALTQAGVLLSAEVLQPSGSTTTVTSRDGRLQIQDGPYVDSKEQLGGTFVIEVPDLDAALGWAQQAPSVEWGAVEVRPGAVWYTDGAWRRNE